MAEIESVKIPIISEDQTGPGFASATGNTKKFSQSIRQMSEEYETSTGRSFRAMSRGLDISTFGLISFAAIGMKVFSDIKKTLEESMTAYEHSNLASEEYLKSIEDNSEASKAFEISTGQAFSGIVTAWHNMKTAAMNYFTDPAVKAAVKHMEELAAKNATAGISPAEARKKEVASIMGAYSPNQQGSSTTQQIESLFGVQHPQQTLEEYRKANKISLEEETAYYKDLNKEKETGEAEGLQLTIDSLKSQIKYIEEQNKQLAEMRKEKQADEDKDWTEYFKTHWADGTPKTTLEMNDYKIALKGMEKDKKALEDIIKNDAAADKTTLTDSKKDWQGYGAVVSSTFSLIAAGANNKSKDIINSISGISSSLFTAASIGGSLGWAAAGIGALASVVGMFSSDSSGQDASKAQAATAAKTASHYDSVTRQGPQIYNITPTIVITSQNGVQVFGDSSVTTGSLMNLIRQALSRDIANNAINLAGAAPAGAGL